MKNEDFNKIHFGMPTLIELNSLIENVELCTELTLDFIELNMNIPFCSVLGHAEKDNDELNKFIEEINLYKKKYNIYFTIHLDENFNFADINPYVRKAYLKTLKAVIDNAKKIDCPIINMHLNHGIYFTLPTEKVFLLEKYSNEYDISVNDFIKFCNFELSDSTIKICIENTDGWKNFETYALKKILENKNLALTFDIGHSEAIGNLDKDFILQNISKLKHFHIHDGTLPDAKTNSYGKNHLELGTGKIDLLSNLNLALKTNSRCVIETKTIQSLKNSVAYLKNNF